MITIRLPHGEWRFDPTQRLGAPGGFGEVFVGVGFDGGSVAVKRLYVTADQAAHRELRIADRLMSCNLTNVIPVLDAGQDADSDRYFLVMSRAERSLQDEINASASIPLPQAVDILLQICTGLAEVADLVHRDLKPANVLRHDGQWKVADFGIARFVEESTSLETLKNALSPQYAAPEQWNLEHATGAADVYSLGCIAYALLNGSPPFTGPTLADFKTQHLTATPSPLVCSDARLSSLVSMMLRKAPESRPTLTRVTTVLRTIQTTPEPTRVGVVALQQIGAVESERRAKAEAERAAAIAAIRRRQELEAAAIAIFDDILQAFAQTARDADPNVHVAHVPSHLTILVGHASLGAQLTALANGRLGYSGWDLIAGGRIEVKQESPPWSHGASLWYIAPADANGIPLV